MSDICLNHIENYWKNRTEISNQLFEEKQFKKALIDYKNALYRSEVLNNYPASCKELGIPFAQIYLISCNNLFNTYEALGHSSEAEHMLKRKILFLLQFKASEYIDQKQFQSELKRAALAYFDFTEQKDSSTTKQTQLYKTLQSEITP